VEDGVDGLKVPMRDAGAWAAAMGKLLREPARCATMAESGAAKLRRDFTEGKWLKRMESIYDRATGRNVPGGRNAPMSADGKTI
jgi:glycosyltransferase involved in cell wall biosynthesis